MSCHSATFALWRGCLGPREWLAVKGPQLSQQNQKPHGKNKIPHGKTKNLTAKTKYLTAKPNTSQQKQKSFGFAVGTFTVIWLSKSCRFMIISISAYRFEVLNN